MQKHPSQLFDDVKYGRFLGTTFLKGVNKLFWDRA